MNKQQEVYLIHFDMPYVAQSGKGKKTAQHYCGMSVRVDERMEDHRTGQGNPLMRAVSRKGIPWRPVWSIPGGHALELAFKRTHKLAKYCPVCNPSYQEYIDRLRYKLEHGDEKFL